MRALLVRTLLRLLNSRFINQTPCRYGFIGNIDAFDYDHLVSEEKQRPGITVKTIIQEADTFRSCPINTKGLTVIDAGVMREANVWDLHDLRNMGGR